MEHSLSIRDQGVTREKPYLLYLGIQQYNRAIINLPMNKDNEMTLNILFYLYSKMTSEL